MALGPSFLAWPAPQVLGPGITKGTSVDKGVRIHSEFSGQDCSPAPSVRCSISALTRSVSDSGRSAEIINNGGLMWYLCDLTTVKGFEISRAKSCAEPFQTLAEEECRGSGHFHYQWMRKLQLPQFFMGSASHCCSPHCYPQQCIWVGISM